ncbi:MAG: carboxynorspermidine decarboxylase, partial [Candidatus Thiodiazotropha sp.]
AKPHTYRLGGMTCLAGDIIGDYAFDQPLQIGDQVIFEDMILYTMVKTTMFNGVAHPAIAIQHENGDLEVVRRFGFEDYQSRLS